MKVQELLNKLGCKKSNRGYFQTIDIIDKIRKNEEILYRKTFNEIYVEVGKKYQCQVHSIIRNIRYLIKQIDKENDLYFEIFKTDENVSCKTFLLEIYLYLAKK